MAAGGENSEQADQSESRPPSTPPGVNIAMKCVLKADLDRFIKCFEDEEDPFHESVINYINERNEDGKTPLDMAAILGRDEMLKELITRGAEVNKATASGYTSLHHAACWGKIGCLKALVDNGADLQPRTRHGERAREAAVRYNQTECVDFLDWAEAKQALLTAINQNRETIQDPEKIQGRLSRDDKNTVLNTCNEKADWVENTSDATTQDFISQKLVLEETLAPVWAKLVESPTEVQGKK